MQIQEAITAIEEYAPLKLQADYDNSGLICGDPTQELTSVLLCLDITETIIEEAISQGHNLIISHHPLIFKGLKHITPTSQVERCVIRALQHHITIYAAHTNMDSVINGVNGRIADKLNLTQRKILNPIENSIVYGYGIVGTLPTPENCMDFLHKVKDVFHCQIIRHTNPHQKQIQRIAVCGGSGAEFIQQAITEHADLYISSDFKYHDFFTAENRITIADIGHYESEQFTKEIFHEILTKKIPKFAVQISSINTNPIKYL